MATAEDFSEALSFILKEEGGYVNDPNDPGGETNMGISRKSYPREDIANMTRDRAGEIYKRDYWDRMKCDELPLPVALVLFDAAVNIGVGRASVMAQNIVKADPDGIIGPRTVAKIRGMSPIDFVLEFSARRCVHYANLPTAPRYGLGWFRRTMRAVHLALKVGA